MRVDFGQAYSKASNVIITALLSAVLYFVVKADRKLDAAAESNSAQDIRIAIHESAIRFVEADVADLKKANGRPN